MILTITMNPAIDKSTSVEKLVPEQKLQCQLPVAEPGGGGINVSKAIRKLGGETLAVFTCGGLNGQLLETLLQKEGIHTNALAVPEETRENFIVLETSTNNQYRFGMPGMVAPESAQECLQLLATISPVPEFIVASGSLPAGIEQNFYAEVAAIARKRQSKLILDTSGTALQMAANEGVYLLKPNLSELCKLTGAGKLELEEVDEAAQQVIAKGHCEVVVVSLGPAGAMLVTADHYETISAPPVKKQSTVGAGDSMVAGMVWMLRQGKSLREMLRFGVACGTAATMNKGTQLFNKEDVYRLYSWLNNKG
jgi:6-phosphofructokinase 2